ncbi:MAG TPA: preprotein translocase subunit SecG [Caulobacteraceae bacterium]|jgi:preprotein translocase subunit SecG|nr:preprotein translocase subunit SecG [Caulobacteraceae bacterium]
MLLDVLLALIIIICIAMVGVILLQKSEGGALGMGGGGPGSFMTARGAGDLLTRTTQILAALFFGLCLVMTMLSGHNRAASITDRLKISGIAPPQPVAPAVPATAPETNGPASGAAPPAAPSGQLGLFGEPEAAAKAKPGATANPLANITVQSSAPAARH